MAGVFPAGWLGGYAGREAWGPPAGDRAGPGWGTPRTMKRLCPECLGALEVRDGEARCTVHGGHYKILFWREVSAVVSPTISPAAAAVAAAAVAAAAKPSPESPPGSATKPAAMSGAMAPPAAVVSRRVTNCVNHDNLPAMYSCRRCQVAICDLCALPQENGSRLCAACAGRRAPEPVVRGGNPGVKPGEQTRNCRQHPGVVATRICQLCGVPMCDVCDTLMPGNIHVCAACAPPGESGAGRKGWGKVRNFFKKG